MRNLLQLRTALYVVLVLFICTLPSFAEGPYKIIGPFARVGDYEVLRCDFHMHTVNSDGRLTARERVAEVKSRGIDGMAIADHGNARAARFELQYAPTQGIVPVRGMETGLPGGLKFHLVALGFDPLYSPKNPHRWSATPGDKTAYYRDEMLKLRNAGGLLVLAHPSQDSFTEPILWGIQQGIIQGIELHNSRTFIPIGFDMALKYNLAVFADSDAHGNGAPNYTLVFAKQKTAAGITDAIRARRTIGLYDGVFWGRQDMLSLLVNATIKVRQVDENNAHYAVIENTGPVGMKGTTSGGQVIDVADHSQVRIPWNGDKAISITWDNAFVSSRDKLTTALNVVR